MISQQPEYLIEAYTIERNDNMCVVTLRGDLTAALVPGLMKDLKKEVQSCPEELVFDLGNTVMLDSTGIRLLIAAGNSIASRKGSVRILNVSDNILQVFEKMSLISTLNISGR
jgi:anti-anti-sigma factor